MQRGSQDSWLDRHASVTCSNAAKAACWWLEKAKPVAAFN